MISIGSILGGPEQMNGPIQLAIRKVSKATTAECGDESVPEVNVVFCVPGSLNTLDFEYPRTGKFSRKQQRLMVQIPLPDEIQQEAS